MKLFKLTLVAFLALGLIACEDPHSKSNIKPEVSHDHPMYKKELSLNTKSDTKKQSAPTRKLKTKSDQEQDLSAHQEQIQPRSSKQRNIARLQRRRALQARERAYRDHPIHEVVVVHDPMALEFEEYARARHIMRRHRYNHDAHIARYERDFAHHQARHAMLQADHARFQAELARRERDELYRQARAARQQPQPAAQPTEADRVAQQIASDHALAQRLQAEEVERAARAGW